MKKYPTFIKTADGNVGRFWRLDFGEFPVYRFEGGERVADNSEIKSGVVMCDRCQKAKAVEHSTSTGSFYCKRCYKALTDPKTPY